MRYIHTTTDICSRPKGYQTQQKIVSIIAFKDSQGDTLSCDCEEKWLIELHLIQFEVIFNNTIKPEF